MSVNLELKKLKDQIISVIRSNSDRGFVPYGACNRVCAELLDLSAEAERSTDKQYSFSAHLLILVEAIKLIAHADTSSGMVTDVIHQSLRAVDDVCQLAEEKDRKLMFEAIVKTAKNKVFQEWNEFGYALLKSAVRFVDNHKQADKLRALYPILGKMYSDKDYPDKYLIELGIIRRLEGEEAERLYLMQHLDVDELRALAVERAMSMKQYDLAEKLCTEAMKIDHRRRVNVSQWALFLERIYAETSNDEKLGELLHRILLQGHHSYFAKLKAHSEAQGTWGEEMKDKLLDEVAEVVQSPEYASLLIQQGENQRLLFHLEAHPHLIAYYGKELARFYPDETISIFHRYILKFAADTSDRRGYKAVCKLIKQCYVAGGKNEALQLIDRLKELYPRRPALIDELTSLRARLK